MVLSNKDFAFFGDLYVSFPFVVPEKIYVKGIGELTLNSKKRNINIIRLIFKQTYKILDIQTEDSGPSDGDTLLATPAASPPRELLLLTIVMFKFSSGASNLSLRSTVSKSWILFDSKT